LRLVTWNVNGIRAVLKKGFLEMMAMLDPDILCIQETKAQPDQIEIDEDFYPYMYINSAQKKGYSGTMIFSRYKPLSVRYGIGQQEHDNEGRVITLEFENFYVLTVYTPNAGENLKRLDYRALWDEAFTAYMTSLDKPVLACGDFNVARGELDIWDVKDGIGSGGFTDTEKAGFENLLSKGFVDAYRYLYPAKNDQFTWWSYYSRGRDANKGWRIDYWLVSQSIQDKIEDVQILDDIYGSDHCPVELDIDLNP
jgi:exodeoxyribonuclease-3